MDVALAQPDGELAAGYALEPHPEEHVGQEEDLAVGWDGVDDGPGVARGAAVVALRLDRGRRVDIRDHDRARMLRLPVTKLVGRDRIGERTPGGEVRQKHALGRREDLGRLGHERDAAEDDRRLRCRRGNLGKPERVADVIGHVLDLGPFVAVGQDDGVVLAGQAADFGLQAGERRRVAGRGDDDRAGPGRERQVRRREGGAVHGGGWRLLRVQPATSSDTSSALAECVREPIETKSTPVAPTS